MANFSTELKKSYQIRSLSLPSKLNPINQKIEQELKRLRTKEETSTSASESIIIGVSGLVELCRCINQALSLRMTQQALSLRKHEKHVGDLLKGCSSLLNICSSIKEATTKLNSSFSEKQESSKIGSHVACCTCSRKDVIRKARYILSSLNQLDAKVLQEEDCHLSTVTKSLRCVSSINLSVFESLLVFLSMPVSKPKRSLVSKLMNEGRDKCESGNEINDVDFVLHGLVSGKSVNEEKCSSVKKVEGVSGCYGWH